MVARDEPRATRDKRPIHSTQLLGLKHGELRSSKTARQWKNPLKLGESPPPAVLAGLAGTGVRISPTPDGAGKYLPEGKEGRQNVASKPQSNYKPKY